MFRKKTKPEGLPTRIQPIVEMKERGDGTVMLFTDEEHAIPPRTPEGRFIGIVRKDQLKGLQPPLVAVTEFEGAIGTISIRSAERKG